MIPIFEQGNGRGVGLLIQDFEMRFAQLCKEQLRDGKAKSFAFIFYDFTNETLRAILKDKGVFAQLDRLAGKELSIFFLHSKSRRGVDRFNNVFLSKIGLADSVSLPCVVFFQMGKEGLKNVSIAQLDSASEIHAFHELHTVIENYLGSEITSSKIPGVKWIKRKAGELSTALFAEALFKYLEDVFRG